MKRILYHGSQQIVRKPHFGAGNSYNDFGLGFYCTEDPLLASEWATDQGRNGFISRYSLNDEGLRIIDLRSPAYSPLHWLGLILSYREIDTLYSSGYKNKEYIRSTFSTDHQGSDCIQGPRADNANFIFAEDFLNDRITYGCFKEALRLGSEGKQIALKSNRAFDRIVFEGYERVTGTEGCPLARARDRELIERAYGLKAAKKSPGAEPGRILDMYASDIADNNIRPYDREL